MTRIHFIKLGLATLVMLGLVISPLGCSSSSDNPAPSGPPTGGASGTGGSGNAGTGSGGDGGQSACVLDPTDECFMPSSTCTPTTNAELLDTCTNAACSKFDNSNLPATLPPIP